MDTETKERKKSFHPLRTLFLLILMLAAVAAACRLLIWRDGRHPQLAGNADRPSLSGLLRLPGAGHGGGLLETLRLRGEYPEALKKLAENEPDAADYVRGWADGRGRLYDAGAIDLRGELLSGGIPLLLQWDARWGYADYGSSALGLTGCGPTCLSMVAAGLTGDAALNPLAVAEYSSGSGWYIEGAGTSWELMRSGAEHFGLRWEELPLDDGAMRAALDAGRPIIASMLPGDFTESGHYVVLAGCGADGYRVLDPNSPTRSAKAWSYETLSRQIGNLWAYEAAD
jgi:hypothetical protein